MGHIRLDRARTPAFGRVPHGRYVHRDEHQRLGCGLAAPGDHSTPTPTSGWTRSRSTSRARASTRSRRRRICPPSTDPVLIDGYTQPGTSQNTAAFGTNAVLLIELDGGGTLSTGINVSGPAASGSTVQGLAVGGFIQGVRAGSGADNCVVRGNFLGTDATGMLARPDNSGLEIGGNNERHRRHGGRRPKPHLGQYRGHVQRGAPARRRRQQLHRPGQPDRHRRDRTARAAQRRRPGRLRHRQRDRRRRGRSGERRLRQRPLRNVDPGQHRRAGQPRRNRRRRRLPAPQCGGRHPIHSSNDSTIGGILPGKAISLPTTAASGVDVEEGVHNTVRGNSIHDNGLLGINLYTGGSLPKANDAGDVDNGSNNLQNFPILKTVTTGASTHVVGKLDSTPSTTFDLDFYANPVCSNFPREFVEGQTWLGTAPVTTDATGHAAIDVTLPVETETGARIIATATDPSGNTSEFSQRIVFAMTSFVSGPAAGGTPISLIGTDFADPTTMTIGGVPVPVTFGDDHTLQATSPALDPGTVNDLVVTDAGRHDRHAHQGVGGRLPRRPGRPAVLLLRHDPGLERDHGRRRPGPLRRRPAHPAPADGRLPHEGEARPLLRPAALHDPDLHRRPLLLGLRALDQRARRRGHHGRLRQRHHLLPDRPRQAPADGRPAPASTLEGLGYTPPACVTATFGDVPCDSPFAPWIYDLVARNITGGCGGGNYCPADPATRGQMAVFVTKTFGSAMTLAARWPHSSCRRPSAGVCLLPRVVHFGWSGSAVAVGPFALRLPHGVAAPWPPLDDFSIAGQIFR